MSFRFTQSPQGTQLFICVQIMVATTATMLFAGRFGLAPSVNKPATAGLKLQEVDGGVKTGDPAGAWARVSAVGVAAVV